MYLVAQSVRDSIGTADASKDALIQQIRRFNVPVQLALLAASEVLPFCEDPTLAYLVSVAPCTNGSEELYSWGRSAVPEAGQVKFRNVRMNPTHTLHAIDNLALSAFAMITRHRGEFLGLGGAPGEAWVALESIRENLQAQRSSEAILLSGDQNLTNGSSKGLGIAALFSTVPKPERALGKLTRFDGFIRNRMKDLQRTNADSAKGICRFLASLGNAATRDGRFLYDVPTEDGDGFDAVSVQVEFQTV